VNSDNRKFAALLLFQFRVDKNGISNKKRICEERIIHFFEKSPDEALVKARTRGKEEEFDYEDNGKHVYFEFVGIVELIDLISLGNEDEVWSILVEKVLPMERKNNLIPDVNKLNVFKNSKGKLRI
jgi:hypothetical protein